jgi:hypothetical protein
VLQIFCFWFFVVIIKDVRFSLSSVLAYTRFGPKGFWIPTAAFGARHSGLHRPNHAGSFFGNRPVDREISRSNIADLDS